MHASMHAHRPPSTVDGCTEALVAKAAGGRWVPRTSLELDGVGRSSNCSSATRGDLDALSVRLSRMPRTHNMPRKAAAQPSTETPAARSPSPPADVPSEVPPEVPTARAPASTTKALVVYKRKRLAPDEWELPRPTLAERSTSRPARARRASDDADSPAQPRSSTDGTAGKSKKKDPPRIRLSDTREHERLSKLFDEIDAFALECEPPAGV